MTTETCYWLLCFVPVGTNSIAKIFGFSEFLAAVALLAVVYTIADVRYKFRIAVTPGSLYVTTFGLIAIIGLQTLLTEIWIAEGWWVPKTVGLTHSIWQSIFGLLFLGTFLTWMYYAFIRPPVFGWRNARRFAQELYRYISRGNDDELKVIANELVRSARPLIKYAGRLPSHRFRGNEASKNEAGKKFVAEGYAHDILLLIANRKLCRHIVAVSPVTAQVFFEEMASEKTLGVPMSQFARNISSEAICQNGSFLYEETEGYTSGLLGYLKPVSQALYGNYVLIEALADNGGSPLDIHFEEQLSWNAKKWKAYCRATLLTLKDFLDNGGGFQNSYALNRAFGNIERAYHDLYKLNDIADAYATDIYARLDVAVKFVRSAIDMINEQGEPPISFHRVREKTYPQNIYDHLALLIFDMCFNASTVKAPPDTCWMIHHNTVWGPIFSLAGTGRAWKIVHFKVRRLLYDEIVKLNDLPNSKGSRILGYCLNVLGLEARLNKQAYQREEYALAKAVQSWTRKGYLRMRQANPDVAKSVLIGSLSFDEVGVRLVKTHAKGLNREPPKTYLELEPLVP